MMSKLRRSPAETIQGYCAASDMPAADIANMTVEVLSARGPDGVSDGSRSGPPDDAAGETSEVTHAATQHPLCLR